MNGLETFDVRGFVLIAALWLGVVVVARFIADKLFPRVERQEGGAPPFAPARLYPAPPRPLRQRVRAAMNAPSSLAVFNPAYWRSNLRLIVPLLLVWLAVILGPTLLAPFLNQFQFLTGFPLGYYLAAQGALIVFLAIIIFYAWRAARLDHEFQTDTMALQTAPRGQRVSASLVWFVVGLVGFALGLGILESQFGLDAYGLGWAFLIVTLALYAIIGITNRTRLSDEYYVAGRQIPSFFNGMAIAGDWMSAASFLSMAGTLWLLGFEGLAYIIGWTGGFVLVALLLAPYLRRFGQFTIPDFIGARYGGSLARIIAALITVMISFTYVTAQVTGIGIIMNRFLGVNYLLGVMMGLGAVLFCSYLGGLRAITWTQVAQCVVLLVAYLTPVTLLSLKDTGVPFPQLMYGEALKHIVDLEALNGITNSYIEPFNDWTPWNFLALTLCLMLGTAGMPHILVRFYTVPNVSAARRSVSWAMIFIALLYFTAPAYAAFSRWKFCKMWWANQSRRCPAGRRIGRKRGC